MNVQSAIYIHVPSYSLCCYAALVLTVDITCVELAIVEVQKLSKSF